MLCNFTLTDNEEEKLKFERIYKEYRKRMHYSAFRILMDEQEAENLVHDTFVTLIDHLDQIDETDCHRTWNYIVTILKNKCYNYLKRQKRIELQEDALFLSEEAEDAAAKVIQREDANLLVQSIRSMKYPYKEALYLYYYNGLNSKEIGKIMGLSSANVRQIIRRARQKLGELLQKEGYQYGE